MTEVTQADHDAEAAFDRHIVDTIGWTQFASMQTAASGAEYGRAFKAGYLAHHNQSNPRDEGKADPELLAALEALFLSYKELADSGDAGNWYLEDQPVGKKAMAAIAKARGEVA